MNVLSNKKRTVEEQKRSHVIYLSTLVSPLPQGILSQVVAVCVWQGGDLYSKQECHMVAMVGPKKNPKTTLWTTQ